MDKSTVTTQIISSDIFKKLTIAEQQEILTALEQSTDAQFLAIQHEFMNTTQELENIKTTQHKNQQAVEQAAKEMNESVKELEKLTLKNNEAQEKIATDQAAESLFAEQNPPITFLQKIFRALKKLF